ncbi:M23 family metallopeptidase [Konateibacter massiliensis]|uniref:M23 family metallopeptidase n=1 Tax=Konateibacter massiliensis TaxID=2002841 RepID=UPI001F464B4C|nr:M23 family metallopeptidase [Konateibacter massiliensis]
MISGISNRKLKAKYIYILVLFLLLCCIYIVSLENMLYRMTGIKNLTEHVEETMEFRSMNLSEGVLEKIKGWEGEEKIELPKLLTIFMLDNNFDLTNSDFKTYDIAEYEASYSYKAGKRQADLERLVGFYDMIWSDVVYFPVPMSSKNEKATVSFENSWLAERTYGGKRFHEGTDIMAGINEAGLYPVVSMSDGVVEKLGWLEKGGWRIGVRTPKGAYLYYAHLDSYAENIKEGESVTAGEFLGYMGNSGYGEEGTTGNFDVHLHVGIYIDTENTGEESINPYWILRYLEDKKLSYSY